MDCQESAPDHSLGMKSSEQRIPNSDRSVAQSTRKPLTRATANSLQSIGGPNVVNRPPSILTTQRGRAATTELKPLDDIVSTDSEAYPEKMFAYRSKSISEVAAQSKNTAGSRYKLLPKDYPQPICSGRGALENEVLNNDWVCASKPSGKVIKRKNIYENRLNHFEDERYEMDMNIERISSTINALEPTVRRMGLDTLTTRQVNARVRRTLNSIHYRTIRNLYGKREAEFIQDMKKNPRIALPIALERLKQKDESSRKARNALNEALRNVSEEDYFRSFDHRSVPFKKADRIELSPKILLKDLVDPGLSLFERDAEHAKERGFHLVTSGGVDGVVNDRSRAVEAVVKAEKEGPPYVLYLSYDYDSVHRIAYELIGIAIQEHVDHAGAEKNVMESFRKLIVSFFSSPFDKEDNKSDFDDRPNIIFGNETLYLMFRYYDCLYERLVCAHKLADQASEDESFRNELNKKGKIGLQSKSHIPRIVTHPSGTVQTFTATKNSRQVAVNPPKNEAPNMLDEYMDQFKKFYNKELSVDQYENSCRALLGPKSFILHTLDKTLVKVAEFVLKSCGSEFVTRKYIDLYHESKSQNFSTARSSSLDLTTGLENALHDAAVNYFEKEIDRRDTLYRLQFAKQDVGMGILVISTVGQTSSEEDRHHHQAISKKVDKFLGF